MNSKMATTKENEGTLQIHELEKVTVWYRCVICRGCFYSIPQLKKHAATVHNNPSIVLPKNLPPGAENGRIYYDYDLPCHQLPASYTYTKLCASSLIAESDYYSTRCRPKPSEALTPKSSSAPVKVPVLKSSPPERDYGIRVRQLEELQDASSGEEEIQGHLQNADVSQRKSRNPSPGSLPRTPVLSPPDSGIQMHDAGSEFQDDEGNHDHPVGTPSAQPAIITTAPPPSNTARSSEPLPSTSTAPPPVSQDGGKFQCNKCDKKFSNVPSLNFHCKKFHPESIEKPKEPVVSQLAPPSEKVVIRIQKNSTGNLTSSSNKNAVQGQENTGNRARNCSSSSSESGSDTQTVFLPRKKQDPEKNGENDKPSSTKPAKGRNPESKSQSSRNDNVSLAESDDIPPSRNSRKRRVPVTQFISSSTESEESEFEVSSSKKKVTRKTNIRLRNRQKQSKIESSSESSSSPIARKTRSRVSKLKSPTPSSSESESESGSGTESEDSDESDDKDDEGELSDRSTTSSEDSVPPPPLTDCGSKNNTKSKKKSTEKDKRVETSYSSDSSDLFTEIKVKKKKSKKVDETKEGDQKDGSTSSTTKKQEEAKKKS